jgi:hypothetical protein
MLAYSWFRQDLTAPGKERLACLRHTTIEFKFPIEL